MNDDEDDHEMEVSKPFHVLIEIYESNGSL